MKTKSRYAKEYMKAMKEMVKEERIAGKVPSHLRVALKSHAKRLGRVRSGIAGKLLHVDYDCEGVVKRHPQFSLKCTKCGATPAFGPMTVVRG